MHYKCRLRYGSTRRIKSKNILVRFPPDCGFEYPVPQLRCQAIENDSSAGFLESDAFMTGANLGLVEVVPVNSLKTEFRKNCLVENSTNLYNRLSKIKDYLNIGFPFSLT